MVPVAKGECRGVWIHGEPGSGKSWLARIISHGLIDPRSLNGRTLVLKDVEDLAKEKGYKENDSIPYIKAGNKWWTGYRG